TSVFMGNLLEPASAGGIATVDDQLRAGDETRFLRREVDHPPGDVIGFAEVAQRVQCIQRPPAGSQVVATRAQVGLDHGRPDETRVHRVHADPVRGVDQCVGPAHQRHSALGGVVGRYVGCAHEPIDGREVDDAAATPAPHVCDHVLGAEEHPFYVDRLHTVPLGLGDLVGRLVDTRYAGVVDQDVDAAV